MDWNSCSLCPFGSWATKVWFRGYFPNPDILLVGEAPGKREEHCGVPFSGQSGMFLDQTLDEAKWSAMGVRWAYINALLCRPCTKQGGANKPPNTKEIHNCAPRLHEQIISINPSAIVALGKTADLAVRAVATLDTANIHSLWHPAYLLRRGGMKSAEYAQWKGKLINIGRKYAPVLRYGGGS